MLPKFKLAYFGRVFHVFSFLLWGAAFFIAGYFFGARDAFDAALQNQKDIIAFFTQKSIELFPSPSPTPIESEPTPQPKPVQNTKAQKISYSGPELWESVNKARVEHGVGPLKQKDILCTIAAIRLSQIRELGKLDNHDGFQGVYDKYKEDQNIPNNVSEFLISGYPTPDQAVAGWLDTLGHKKLITGGEYVWGCIYAADDFGVAITGF